jgi:hypothetical protein
MILAKAVDSFQRLTVDRLSHVWRTVKAKKEIISCQSRKNASVFVENTAKN